MINGFHVRTTQEAATFAALARHELLPEGKRAELAEDLCAGIDEVLAGRGR